MQKKPPRFWLIARALLSAVVLRQQRAAEIGRKRCYDNAAAAARKVEKNLPLMCLHEQRECARWGQTWVRIPLVPRQPRSPVEGSLLHR